MIGADFTMNYARWPVASSLAAALIPARNTDSHVACWIASERWRSPGQDERPLATDRTRGKRMRGSTPRSFAFRSALPSANKHEAIAITGRSVLIKDRTREAG